uniref:Uncharacterized protein n=1 Tax=Spongospora subterranea TaxID=70186 RepID=A0A0H5RDU2_9EUKA|eukprot:CRZ12415.1 hypothetical protein [Spongospora subterranea]
MLEDMAFLSLFLEWTIGHLHLIQLTWESSSYAMPLGSLYFVFAWNIFKTVYSHSPLSFVFGAIWTCCDLVIIYLTIRNLRRPDNPDFFDFSIFQATSDSDLGDDISVLGHLYSNRHFTIWRSLLVLGRGFSELLHVCLFYPHGVISTVVSTTA